MHSAPLTRIISFIIQDGVGNARCVQGDTFFYSERSVCRHFQSGFLITLIVMASNSHSKSITIVLTSYFSAYGQVTNPSKHVPLILDKRPETDIPDRSHSCVITHTYKSSPSIIILGFWFRVCMEWLFRHSGSLSNTKRYARANVKGSIDQLRYVDYVTTLSLWLVIRNSLVLPEKEVHLIGSSTKT